MRGNEIKKTPLIHSPTFSELTKSEVYLKAEFRQKTGSFKIRGVFITKSNHYRMKKRNMA